MAEPKFIEAFNPGYLSGLDQLPLAELRAKRDVCAELETGLSYLRRLAQARIDLIMAESERRHLGLSVPGPDDLVERLPQILGDYVRADGPDRFPAFFAPAEGMQTALAARVEQLLPSDRLGSLAELHSEELDKLLSGLSALEREVSTERQSLHEVQDRLQEELVRRYRSGEASVDALLADVPGS
jgi:hypothetical protein